MTHETDPTVKSPTHNRMEDLLIADKVPTEARQFMHDFDEGLYDEPVKIRQDFEDGRVGGVEYWQIKQADIKIDRDEYGNEISRTPWIKIQQGSDEQGNAAKIEMPMMDFLRWKENADKSSSEVLAANKAITELGKTGLVVTTDLEPVEVVDSADESSLNNAKRAIENSNKYDNLFGANKELEDAKNALSPSEMKEFEAWQIERAAVRKKNPFQIIGSHSKETPYKTRKIDKEYTDEFIESLGAYGVSAEAPSEGLIRQGIDKAKKIVDSGSAAAFLSELPFVDEKQAQALFRNAERTIVTFDKKAYVDPELVKGCAGHDSWAGRGYAGTASVDVKEKEVSDKLGKSKRSSIEQIEDYATRDTALPGYDEMNGGGLMLIITKDGPVFIASSAHRSSAAKLRGEPLSFDTLTIYNAAKL